MLRSLLVWVLVLGAGLAPLIAAQANAAGTGATPPASPFSFAEIVAQIATKEPSWSAIDKINAATKVTFVELSGLHGYNADALRFTPSEQQLLVELDAKVGRNPVLMKKLRHAGFFLSDVVGLAANEANKVIVFINL